MPRSPPPPFPSNHPASRFPDANLSSQDTARARANKPLPNPTRSGHDLTKVRQPILAYFLRIALQAAFFTHSINAVENPSPAQQTLSSFGRVSRPCTTCRTGLSRHLGRIPRHEQHNSYASTCPLLWNIHQVSARASLIPLLSMSPAGQAGPSAQGREPRARKSCMTKHI